MQFKRCIQKCTRSANAHQDITILSANAYQDITTFEGDGNGSKYIKYSKNMIFP